MDYKKSNEKITADDIVIMTINKNTKVAENCTSRNKWAHDHNTVSAPKTRSMLLNPAKISNYANLK